MNYLDDLLNISVDTLSFMLSYYSFMFCCHRTLASRFMFSAYYIAEGMIYWSDVFLLANNEQVINESQNGLVKSASSTGKIKSEFTSLESDTSGNELKI